MDIYNSMGFKALMNSFLNNDSVYKVFMLLSQRGYKITGGAYGVPPGGLHALPSILYSLRESEWKGL